MKAAVLRPIVVIGLLLAIYNHTMSDLFINTPTVSKFDDQQSGFGVTWQVVPPEVARNRSSCFWIRFINYGRSGNRIHQLKEVNKVLSHCSGVATSSPDVNMDPGAAFPPITIATRGESHFSIDSLLKFAALSCHEVEYAWESGAKLIEHCGSAPVYRIHPDITGHALDLTSGTALNVFTDIGSWKVNWTDMMVMYFRGGDILRPDAHSGYSQAPCSLFLNAFKFVNASRLMLVFDPRAALHPCIHVVRSNTSNFTIVPTPCDSVGCHLTLLARAPYLVISGVTTFASEAMSLFPRRKRVIFQYFCAHPPVDHGTTIEICAAGNTTAFRP